MWVDDMMHKAVWEASLRKVNDEWREFTLYVSRDIQLRHVCPHHRDMFKATVLLNANVAFLQTPRASSLFIAELSSYFSICTSVGSIVLGLLLVRQNQTKDRETAADVVSE